MAHPISYLSPLAYLCVLQRLQIETTFPTFLSTGVYKWFGSTKQMYLQKIWETAVSYLRWWPHTGDKVIWDTLGESSVSDNQKILLIHLSIYSLNKRSLDNHYVPNIILDSEDIKMTATVSSFCKSSQTGTITLESHWSLFTKLRKLSICLCYGPTLLYLSLREMRAFFVPKEMYKKICGSFFIIAKN